MLLVARPLRRREVTKVMAGVKKSVVCGGKRVGTNLSRCAEVTSTTNTRSAEVEVRGRCNGTKLCTCRYKKVFTPEYYGIKAENSPVDISSGRSFG